MGTVRPHLPLSAPAPATLHPNMPGLRPGETQATPQAQAVLPKGTWLEFGVKVRSHSLSTLLWASPGVQASWHCPLAPRGQRM